MVRQQIRLICQIKEIGKIEKYKRLNKAPFSKRMISLETEDGQLLFCELRKMNLLDNMATGTIVEVYISFGGSERNGKKYNNIFINEMKRR